MAIVASVLGGCASGDEEARRADEAIGDLEHVSESATIVRRPGVPTNRQFTTHLTFVDGVSQSEQEETIDEVLAIAREEIAPAANAGFILQVSGGSTVIDMEAVVASLGDIGTQRPSNLEVGSLSLTADALRAYESVERED
ncbi:hypothetical protein [Demequina aestuarii]|uniref:hypothetical protein n=1 Tax=Demequina aestuarii TaxID=327095 RepID=UPI000B1322A5|nr:hypothetical protein [Demequina aestuarii]